MDEYRKQLYELKETQKAAEWDAAPAEVKIATLQGNIDELKAQNAEIDRLIENARNKQKEAPYLLPLYGESEDYYQSLKQSNLSQIATKQMKYHPYGQTEKKPIATNPIGKDRRRRRKQLSKRWTFH